MSTFTLHLGLDMAFNSRPKVKGGHAANKHGWIRLFLCEEYKPIRKALRNV